MSIAMIYALTLTVLFVGIAWARENGHDRIGRAIAYTAGVTAAAPFVVIISNYTP